MEVIQEPLTFHHGHLDGVVVSTDKLPMPRIRESPGTGPCPRRSRECRSDSCSMLGTHSPSTILKAAKFSRTWSGSISLFFPASFSDRPFRRMSLYTPRLRSRASDCSGVRSSTGRRETGMTGGSFGSLTFGGPCPLASSRVMPGFRCIFLRILLIYVGPAVVLIAQSSKVAY